MNICFVDLKLTKGGSGRVLSILANHFYSKGWNVSIAILDKETVDYAISDGITVHDLEMEKGRNIIDLLCKTIKLRKIMKKQDVVIAFCFRPIFWVTVSTLLSKPLMIYSERNNPYKDPDSALKRLLRNICFYHADSIVFQTEDQKNYFSYRIRKKGEIIKNPILDNLPDYCAEKRRKVVMTACRLEKQKNIKMSIKAFSIFYEKHRDYQFHIYGEGSLKDELTKYISDLGMDDVVSIFDFTNEIHELMSTASAFVLSSDYEGISNSMLEAMAIGIPVICTDCPIGGARENIIHEKNGVLVPVGDFSSMAYYMSVLADDEEFRQSVSCNSREIRKTLDAHEICLSWEKLVSSCNGI